MPVTAAGPVVGATIGVGARVGAGAGVGSCVKIGEGIGVGRTVGVGLGSKVGNGAGIAFGVWLSVASTGGDGSREIAPESFGEREGEAVVITAGVGREAVACARVAIDAFVAVDAGSEVAAGAAAGVLRAPSQATSARTNETRTILRAKGLIRMGQF